MCSHCALHIEGRICGQGGGSSCGPGHSFSGVFRRIGSQEIIVVGPFKRHLKSKAKHFVYFLRCLINTPNNTTVEPVKTLLMKSHVEELSSSIETKA